MIFRADSRQALAAAALAIAAAGVTGLAAVAGAILLPLSLATFLLVLLALACAALAAAIAYRANTYRRTSYAVDRNSLVIRCGATREVVPMIDVQRILPGREVAAGLTLRRLPLPGWWSGLGHHPTLGYIRFYATEPVDRQLIVVTAAMSYAVSPADLDGFVAEFTELSEAGASRPVRRARLDSGLLSLPMWQNRAALALLGLPLVINLLIFGLLLARYPQLPGQVVLHFNAQGLPDRVGATVQVFGPAIIGLGLLAVNSVLGALAYRQDRLAAYLLWGGSAGIQAMFLLAAMTAAFSV
jgi:hypothetical protein